MQKSRRDFVKKSAIVTAGAATVGATVLAASGTRSSQEPGSNGVVVGTSRHKEVIYKKTQAWEEFYKQAK